MTEPGSDAASPRRPMLGRVLIGLGVTLLVIQLVPVDRSNPPVESDLAAPADVTAVLRESCYDCHSHETAWPWYARIAPMSWLVTHDVHDARAHLNFSTWNLYDTAAQAHLQGEIWEEVAAGEMPLWFYLPLHPEARLTDEDRRVLQTWVVAAAPAEGAAGSAAHDHSTHEH